MNTELIDKLKAREQALGDPLDVPRTQRAYADYFATRREIAKAISTLMNPDHLATERRIDDLRVIRQQAVAERERREAELAALPDPQTITDRIDRDRAIAHQHSLRYQLALFAQGSLLQAPGITWPRLDDLDVEIARLERKRDQELSRYTTAVADAESLLAAAAATS